MGEGPSVRARGGAHLQGEGQRQVGLHLSARGQHDLVGAQDALGALAENTRRTQRRAEGRHTPGGSSLPTASRGAAAGLGLRSPKAPRRGAIRSLKTARVL